MATILNEIIAHKREEVAAAKAKISEDTLIEQIENNHDTPRGFMAALRAKAEAKQSAVIAEIKKASPSQGVICENFDPIAIADAYQKAGATCLSVLTDEKYFQGKAEYIAQVKRAVQLPVLRKDFIIDEYQIVESRACGADAILLIVAALSDEELLRFTRLAHDLGMNTLVEVHNKEECERALKLPIRAFGVNNRNLHDFSVSLETSLELYKMLPNEEYLFISESGIETPADIEKLQQAGIYTYLVGTSLMKSNDPGKALSTLLGIDEKRSELF